MAPRIQQVTPRGSAPSGPSVPRLSLSDPVGRAMTQAGQQAADRGLKMLDEHNQSSARSAFNTFRSSTRNKFNELRNRSGGDAHGVTEEYENWHQKEIGRIMSDLGNDRQRQLFELMYIPHREQDLDSLSRHEAVQHRANMQSSLTGAVDRLQADIRMDPFNTERIDLADVEIEESFKLAYPGLDKSAEINQAKAAIRIAALQEMLDPETGNPAMAKQMLKEWKDELGGAYKKLKKSVDSANTKAMGQAHADRIMGGHDKYQDQLKAARKIKNPDVRDDTVKRIKARHAEQKEIERIQTEERRDLKTAQVMQIRQQGLGREKALDLIQTEDDRKAIAPLVRALWGEKQPVDHVAYSDAQDAIDNAIADGAPLTSERIVREWGPKVGERKAGSLLEYNKKGQRNKVKDSITAQKNRIKEMYNRGDFGDLGDKEQKKKASKIKADINVGLTEWIEDNPGKDPTEYVDARLDLQAAEEMADALNTFFGFPVSNVAKKKIASGEHDEELVKRFVGTLKDENGRGYDLSGFTADDLENIANTTEFIEYKTELLNAKSE